MCPICVCNLSECRLILSTVSRHSREQGHRIKRRPTPPATHTSPCLRSPCPESSPVTMASNRAVLVALCLCMMVMTAAAVTCKAYNSQSQAGSRCHTPNIGDACCTNGLWCDMGRCSARQVRESEKLKQCKQTAQQAGDRCDHNNGMCCKAGMRCNVGRCSV